MTEHQPRRSSSARSTSRRRRAPRAGRRCIRTTSSSIRRAARRRRTASGSTTACTSRSRCRVRHDHRRSRATCRSASTRAASSRSRPCSASSTASSTATSTSPRTRSATRPRSRSGSRSSCRGSASTTRTGTRSSIAGRPRSTSGSRSSRRSRCRSCPSSRTSRRLIHDHKLGSNYRLMRAYDRCSQLYNELNQLHFELLLLAYGAYLTFFQFCQGAFPDMGMQVMTQMIAGYDTTMFRPDDELKALAARGARRTVSTAPSPTAARHEEILAELEQSEAGRAWIADLESRKHPWFFMSTGDGFYHHHRAWADDLRLPFTAITGYIAQLRDGHEPRPAEGAAARRARPDRRRVRGAARDATRSASSSTRCSGSAATCSRTPRGTSSSSSTGAPRCSSTRCARSAPVFVRAGLLRERRRRLLPQHPRGARGALRPRPRLVGRHARARDRLLAAAGRAAQGDPREALRVDAAAGARRRAGGDQRPDRAAALGRHRRPAARLGEPGGGDERRAAATPPRRASSRASPASSATSTRSAPCSRARCSSAR